MLLILTWKAKHERDICIDGDGGDSNRTLIHNPNRHPRSLMLLIQSQTQITGCEMCPANDALELGCPKVDLGPCGSSCRYLLRRQVHVVSQSPRRWGSCVGIQDALDLEQCPDLCMSPLSASFSCLRGVLDEKAICGITPQRWLNSCFPVGFDGVHGFLVRCISYAEIARSRQFESSTLGARADNES